MARPPALAPILLFLRSLLDIGSIEQTAQKAELTTDLLDAYVSKM